MEGAWQDVAFDFSGKTVLVTGGSNGIGRGFAEGFRNAGARTIITGTKVQTEYDDDFAGLEYHQLLLTDHAAILALAAEVTTLDVLVNNAGTSNALGTGEDSPEGFEATIAVNLTGNYRVAHAFHDQLAASGGSIINLASMYSYFGSANVPGYSASKGGVVQMTKSLAVGWADDGIRVNAIAPGWVESNLTRTLMQTPAFSDPIVKRTALARWGYPEDCAGPALFLASSAASFITGVTLNVDGGYSIM